MVMRIYKTDKKVLAFKNNAEEFLNGLTSNKMDQPRNAFLTIHGRIVATFDQLRISEDEYWIVLESEYVKTLLAHVDRYLKLGGIKVKELEHNVYFDLDDSYALVEDDHSIQQKHGKLIITERVLEADVTDDEFALFRVKNNIPMQGIDYTDQMLLNVSMSEFVSFTKGCFLGQEPVSKVYNRSKPTWQLTVKTEDQCTDEEKAKMTSRVVNPQSGKATGFVFVKND